MRRDEEKGGTRSKGLRGSRSDKDSEKMKKKMKKIKNEKVA